MKDMTLDKLIEAKAELEEDLMKEFNDRIRRFEQTTGAKVQGIAVTNRIAVEPNYNVDFLHNMTYTYGFKTHLTYRGQTIGE